MYVTGETAGHGHNGDFTTVAYGTGAHHAESRVRNLTSVLKKVGYQGGEAMPTMSAGIFPRFL